MATVNFLYRSDKEKIHLNLRLLFTHNEENFQIGGKTQFLVSKDTFKRFYNKPLIKAGNNIEKQELREQQDEFNEELNKISNFILEQFNHSNPDEVDKEWLNGIIDRYYNPQPEIPTRLIHFFDWLIDFKKSEYSEANVKVIRKVKNKIILFEQFKNKKVFVSDVNYNFKYDYLDFATNGVRKPYALSTIEAHLKVIRLVVYEAERQGKEITLRKSDLQIDRDKIRRDRDEVPEIYLNELELKKLKNTEYKIQSLADVRDWLLISCYTGQRISDFMRFRSKMISKNNKGKTFLNFKQVKTQKTVTIPFIKEAREIIERRNGEFPPVFTFSKYNELVKTVCKIAKIEELTDGKVRTFIGKDPKKATKEDYRDIIGKYPKWQLVSSHIGRRSFATNYYQKKPTHVLIQFTGHSTERQFLEYVKKSNADKAEDASNYFD